MITYDTFEERRKSVVDHEKYEREGKEGRNVDEREEGRTFIGLPLEIFFSIYYGRAILKVIAHIFVFQLPVTLAT
jgi:hypothetical protein